MASGWWRVTAAAAVLAALAGCATPPAQRSSLEKYPPWLIAVADPVAPAVGFVVSHVEFRPGFLGAHKDALARVERTVRPLDILAFSSKGRLSGRTGSGMFGHAAIHLGDERDLRAAGLWDDKALAPHRDAIRAGRVYAESAQAHGTTLSTLETVGNTDRIVIIRPAAEGTAWRRRVTRETVARLGGKFDHRFDAGEPERLYCTELIDQVMPELRLRRRTAYGRTLILPDDLVAQALAGRGLRVVAYLKADADGWRAASAASLAADLKAATAGAR